MADPDGKDLNAPVRVLHGVGPKMVRILTEALHARGLALRD
ncbi:MULTISPECIES: hypothetical protein [Streptomyces]|nr:MULTISPECIES: hypothetical protein [Streptomyces]AJC53364.1 hypothetical protein GZL_00760 [Streptomyces sp. 769]